MSDFETAWNLYPRKVCKKDAQKAWAKLTTEQRFAVIHALPIHVRYWEMSGTAKQFMPHFSTWLNGERWTDELEMPQVADEWWKTQEGIEKKAREVGCWPAKAHEGWHELKARILARMKEAA